VSPVTIVRHANFLPARPQTAAPLGLPFHLNRWRVFSCPAQGLALRSRSSLTAGEGVVSVYGYTGTLRANSQVDPPRELVCGHGGGTTAAAARSRQGAPLAACFTSTAVFAPADRGPVHTRRGLLPGLPTPALVQLSCQPSGPCPHSCHPSREWKRGGPITYRAKGSSRSD
jgi:hypothetical protein